MRMIVRTDRAMASIPDTPHAPARLGGHLKANFREYGMLLALVVIMAFFQYVTNGVLLKPLNLTNLFLQNSYIIIMALGMLLVIVSGHIDLSVGSVARLHRRRWPAVLIVRNGCPVVPTIARSAWSSARRSARRRATGSPSGSIPSFIVTLAGMLVFRGLNLAMLHGKSVGPFPKSLPAAVSSGFVPDFLGGADGLEPHRARARLRRRGGAGLAAPCAPAPSRRAIPRSRSRSRFFVLKNGVIAIAIVYITWLLATARGLPNVLITMAVLIAPTPSSPTRRRSAGASTPSAATRRRPSSPASRPSRLVFLVFTNMGDARGPRRPDHRRAPQLRDAEAPASPSSSTSSPPASSAAPRPPAASGGSSAR